MPVSAPSQAVILITGASRGIGKSIGSLLAARGFEVFGTSRAPVPGAFPMLALDVTSEQSVQQCVQSVLAKAGRLDVLINNAAYGLVGAAEETTLEEARSQMETNFFGVVRMVKACLPIMRRQKGGRILNISSLAGLTAIPFWPYYCASKFALEGFTEALRYEVRPWNIEVALIEPGDIASGMKDVMAGALLHEYDIARERLITATQESIATAPPPDVVARRVLRVLRSSRLRRRYRVGPDSFTVGLIPFAPDRLVEFVMRKLFNQP
jgi:NAD(P)-dependent dehydrogenase (short-subunit alcohol dehydrogenase family)